MPADPPSPIPAALAPLPQTDPCKPQDADAALLRAYLAAGSDPRAARGRRHPLIGILAKAAAAVLAGAQSIAAIAMDITPSRISHATVRYTRCRLAPTRFLASSPYTGWPPQGRPTLDPKFV